MRRVDEQGPKALVQIREPVNKFPDFVRFVVQQLKTLCPTMGKRKMAETLARAGLHLGTTTVGNILKEKPVAPPEVAEEADSTDRVVTSKYANHLWNVDLTTVPIGAGFWCSWLPFTLPQRWPFCWWLAVAVDHHSRRLIGFAAKRRTRAMQRVFPPTASRESNHAQVGHADRRAPNRGRLSAASQGSGSIPLSPSTQSAVTYPS